MRFLRLVFGFDDFYLYRKERKYERKNCILNECWRGVWKVLDIIKRFKFCWS